jgi:hypothetical protein
MMNRSRPGVVGVVLLALLALVACDPTGAGGEPDWYYHWNCNGDSQCLTLGPGQVGQSSGTINEGPVYAMCSPLLFFASRNWNMPPATNSCDHSPTTPVPPPPVPTVVTLVPTTGIQGTSVTLSGSGYPALVAGITVSLGGVTAVVTSVTSNQVVFTVPALPVGSYPVTVTTAGGSATSSSAFSLRAPVLTVAVSGAGSVASLPAGISCGATCAASFPFGSSIRVTATPGASATFNGWMGGGCAATGASCTVTLDADVTVTASFLSETLTVMVSGSGQVVSSPPGINCTGIRSACTASFAPGTVVTLTEVAGTPTVPSTFGGWSGGTCPPGGTTCSLTMDSNVTITARFLTFSLAVVPVGVNGTPGTGTITSVPAGISCAGVGPSATNCLAWFAGGTQVTLTAAPSAGSSFAGWAGSGCTGSGPCTVALDANATVTGQYCVPHATVTSTAPGSSSFVACADLVTVQAWGAGGGGGGNGSSSTGAGGSGGGGGGDGAAAVNVISGEAYLVSVGAAGSAGVGFRNLSANGGGRPTNGGDGGDSSFGTLISATGGRGGTNGPGAGGAGGASAAPTSVAGAPGLVGKNVYWGDGGAGGAGGNGGAGGAGGAGVDYNNPPPVIPQPNGFPGAFPGGGGGGGGWHWFYGYDGAAGANGQVIVTW